MEASEPRKQDKLEKKKLLLTLLELESRILPGDVKKVLEGFGKEILRLFNLECFVAEVPMLGLRVEIPEGGSCDNLTFEGNSVRIALSGEIDGKLKRVLRSLLDRLDYVVTHSIYYEFAANIIERSPDAIILLDRSGRVVRMNRKAAEIFGGMEKLPEFEGEVLQFGGKYYSALRYDLGRVDAVVLRDITTIKELEMAARESEERFRTLAEIVPVAVFVYSYEKWLFVNKAAEELTGHSREELLRGKIFWELLPEDEKEKVREVVRRRLRGEEVKPYIMRIKRKDGEERMVVAYGSTVSWKGERVAISALVDITDIERDRQRLEELTKMLELINRILRHDVLNALTSALAYLEIYEDVRDESLLEKVRDGLERAVAIVKNMKAFEDVVKSGELKLVRVKEMAEEVAKHFNIPINVEGDCEGLADEGLKAVFENIFQNAVQHSGTDRVDVEIKSMDGYCEIRIIDYGIGIPDELKEKVFEEGFKHGPKASTGLGLYAVKRLIERYGGEIWVEDNKPKGAVFVIRLRGVANTPS